MVAPRTATKIVRAPLQTFGYKPNTVEYKVADVNSPGIPINTTGFFTLLCNPTQGADFNNRIGRKIVLKSLYVRGQCGIEPALQQPTNLTAAPQQLVRMVIFIDYQPNGAVPTVADLLTQPSAVSQLNLNNRDRFKVITDKQWVIGPYFTSNTGALTANTGYAIKKFKTLNLEMIFNGTLGTVADINSGALYMFWIGTIASGDSDSVAQISTRVRFADA
jgi:hypothetical protein